MAETLAVQYLMFVNKLSCQSVEKFCTGVQRRVNDLLGPPYFRRHCLGSPLLVVCNKFFGIFEARGGHEKRSTAYLALIWSTSYTALIPTTQIVWGFRQLSQHHFLT